jgi:hypothetical protein
MARRAGHFKPVRRWLAYWPFIPGLSVAKAIVKLPDWRSLSYRRASGASESIAGADDARCRSRDQSALAAGPTCNGVRSMPGARPTKSSFGTGPVRSENRPGRAHLCGGVIPLGEVVDIA